MTIRTRLEALADLEYAAFQAKLTPGVDPSTIIGVRLPVLRQFAKELSKEEKEAFLSSLPHETYDENILHSILLSSERNLEEAVKQVEAFLPYIDNWAVSDTLHPKAFKKRREELFPKVREWIASPEPYTCRVGIVTLMTEFLDEDYRKGQHELLLTIPMDHFYVHMAAAWYFATALAKQWDDTVDILIDRRLPRKTHLKTIQKAVESYRITDEQKEHLRTLRKDV